MSSLLVDLSSESEGKFLLKLLKKMHVNARIVTDEDKLDYGLLKAMESAEKDDFVPKDRIMKILNQNDLPVQKQL